MLIVSVAALGIFESSSTVNLRSQCRAVYTDARQLIVAEDVLRKAVRLVHG